jgi:hypothetical protein
MVIIPAGTILQNLTLKKYAKRWIISTNIFHFVSALSSKIISLKRKKGNQIIPSLEKRKVYFIKVIEK